jgi:MFS family permease
MANGKSDEYLVPRSQAYFVYILLFLLYLFDQADRYVITSLFPFLKAEWALTDTQCGMLVSAVYWSLLIFALPSALLIDRWSRKHTIGIMAVVWSLAAAASAFTKNFAQLFATRTAIGVGEAGYAPGGVAMISGLFPEKKRSLFMGIWMASVPIGAAAGVMLGGIIATQYGWRHAFGVLAFPGLALGILFFFVKDYRTVKLVKTKKDEQGLAKTNMKIKDIAAEFIKKPSLILTYLAYAGNVFATVALLTWLPSFFQRAGGMSVTDSSVKSGIIMLAALVGTPLGGIIADKWFTRRKDARLLFSGISSCVTAVVLFAAFMVPGGGGLQYGLLIAVGVTIAAFNPAAAAVTQDVVHPGLRAISYGLCIIVQHILGSTLGPIFVGAVSDAYNIQTALSLLPIFILASGIMFFIASRFYEKDLVNVERVELQAAT